MVRLRAFTVGAVLASLIAAAVPAAHGARARRCRRVQSVKYSISLIVNPYDPLATGAYAINADGIIGGETGTFSGNLTSRGFLVAPPYSGGNYTWVDYPGSNHTYVSGVNSRGHIAGGWRDASGTSSGYVRINGTFKSFSHPNATGNSTQLNSINDADVAPGLYNSADGSTHGFLWNALTGSITAVEPPNTTGAIATCVNNMEAVSVYAFFKDNSTGSYLLKSGRYYPVAVPDGTDTTAACLNDLDEVVGSYSDKFGVYHGFIGRRLTSRCPVYQTLDVPIPNSTTFWSGTSLDSIVGYALLPEKIKLGLLATKAK